MQQPGEDSSNTLLWTVPQVAKALGLGKNKVYQLIYMEGLPVQKFGRATRVWGLWRSGTEKWFKAECVVKISYISRQKMYKKHIINRKERECLFFLSCQSA